MNVSGPSSLLSADRCEPVCPWHGQDLHKVLEKSHSQLAHQPSLPSCLAKWERSRKQAQLRQEQMDACFRGLSPLSLSSAQHISLRCVQEPLIDTLYNHCIIKLEERALRVSLYLRPIVTQGVSMNKDNSHICHCQTVTPVQEPFLSLRLSSSTQPIQQGSIINSLCSDKMEAQRDQLADPKSHSKGRCASD